MTHFQCCSFGKEAWAILSDIERSIKTKVESVGVPLKDWDVEIYRGVLTGYNDAFIISSEKRDEILANCANDDERKRTSAIIRPILRGRDIKCYNHEWANLWVIFIPWHFPFQFDDTIQGASEIAEKAFKEQYPSVFSHLLRFKEALLNRNKAETGLRYEWYALQRWGANYWDEFSKPKIIWKRVGSILRFSYDENGLFGLDSTCFAVGKEIAYICCLLNSSMGHYLLNGAPRTGTGDLLISVQAVEPIKIPTISPDLNEIFKTIIHKELSSPDASIEEEVDNLIFNLYGLSEEEKEYLVTNFRG